MGKWKSVILPLLIAVTMVAGCSGGGNGSGPQTDAQGENDVKNNSSGTGKTFTALLDNNPTFPYSKSWPVWSWLKERTGVTLEVQTPSGKLDESLNLAIASKSLPDLMYMPNRKESNKFGQQGALVDLMEYMDNMPNLQAWMKQYPEEAKAALRRRQDVYVPQSGALVRRTA